MITSLTIDNGIGTISISNPPFNSFVKPSFIEPEKLNDFLSDERLRAVIIKGDGRHFSSGADISELEKNSLTPDYLEEQICDGKKILKAIHNATIPVIAAIKGSCFGAGLELALACHFRYASKSAMFGFPESTLNLLPGLGGTVYLNRVLHEKSIINLLISGKMIGSEEALKIGLIDHVEQTGEIENSAYQFISALVENRSAFLIRSIMTSIKNASNLSFDDALKCETQLFCTLARKRIEDREMQHE